MTQPLYDLAGVVIGLAMKVHSEMGSGYLESVYKNALVIELLEAGLKAEVEHRLTVFYRGSIVGDFIADIVINRMLIIELKAVSTLIKAHEVQLVNYLAATGIEEGLLFNFGAERLEYKKKFRTCRFKS